MLATGQTLGLYLRPQVSRCSVLGGTGWERPDQVLWEAEGAAVCRDYMRKAEKWPCSQTSGSLLLPRTPILLASWVEGSGIRAFVPLLPKTSAQCAFWPMCSLLPNQRFSSHPYPLSFLVSSAKQPRRNPFCLFPQSLPPYSSFDECSMGSLSALWPCLHILTSL